MKIAIVEQSAIGGACLNRGCIRTKAFLRASRTRHELRATNMNLSAVPFCIYTFPTAATVGMATHAAKTTGKAVRTGKYVTSFNSMHVIEMRGHGFVKVILETQEDSERPR